MRQPSAPSPSSKYVVHLATGLCMQDGRLLLVASHYPNQAEPLWNLPGGRQQHGELLAETVARELLEETGLHVDVGTLAYVSESYDGDTHFLNATFAVTLRPSTPPVPPFAADHIVAVEWVPVDDVAQRIIVSVVRDPLVAYLRGELVRRYAGFHEAGITIQWPDGST